jgi:hypothetical protein
MRPPCGALQDTSTNIAAAPDCDNLPVMSSATRYRLACGAACLFALTTLSLRADLIQLQNGDRYAGKILSMTSNSIVMESDVLGKVTLPRNKVTSLTFGASAAATNAAPALPNLPASATASPTAANANPDLSAALRNLGANTNFIQQVRQQMLTGADPAANQKYDELVGGLMTGKMSLNDLRNQAKTSIDQINQLKRELGPEASDSLDSYLTILQSFVNEGSPTDSAVVTAPGTAATTIAPSAPTASFRTNSAIAPQN